MAALKEKARSVLLKELGAAMGWEKLDLGKTLAQDEAFKVTHTRKKKNNEEPDEWIEPQNEQTYGHGGANFSTNKRTSSRKGQGEEEGRLVCGYEGPVRPLTCFGEISDSLGTLVGHNPDLPMLDPWSYNNEAEGLFTNANKEVILDDFPFLPCRATSLRHSMLPPSHINALSHSSYD
ncbi:hypothetical protein RND71_033867 [Anisodus tanguticus]|uniref:Uncharacterized protein n=1 Tax=Anisodus tanguticus TaxID=243964 RepID=A0AAE1UWI5_9SOLA|nr:hypothetical protein RND71_033867 [Anisodus tanguticus]